MAELTLITPKPSDGLPYYQLSNPGQYNIPDLTFVKINGKTYRNGGNGILFPAPGYEANTTGADTEITPLNSTNTPSTPTPTNTPSSTPTTTTSTPSSTTTDTNIQTDQQFTDWLNSQNLSADQKQAINAIYHAVSTNDANYAQKISQAMATAATYSDPYFKAQVSLVTDALARSLSSKEGDLQFQETQLSNTLNDIKQQIASSKDYLSFQQNQELQDLARKYSVQLESTQNDLAARGFTSSSNRTNAEKLLSDANSGMVESTNRSFANQVGQLDAKDAQATRDTALQVANLQRLTEAGKLDALRSAESQTGTNTLSNLGYTGLLGGVGGEIPAAQTKDQLNFATSLLF